MPEGEAEAAGLWNLNTSPSSDLLPQKRGLGPGLCSQVCLFAFFSPAAVNLLLTRGALVSRREAHNSRPSQPKPSWPTEQFHRLCLL